MVCEPVLSTVMSSVFCVRIIDGSVGRSGSHIYAYAVEVRTSRPPT